MTDKRINPELVLAAKNIVWGDAVVLHMEFDPLTNDTDFKALMLALMKGDELSNGYAFGFEHFEQGSNTWDAWLTDEGGFWHGEISDESFPLLLMRCVASMNGLEVYV